jgi:HSP20 family protein
MAIKKINPEEKKILPVKREEYNPFALLRQEMNALFDNFFRGFEAEPSGGRLSAFRPNIDVAENDKEIKVSAELPGMDEKDIEIGLARDELTIKGEKKLEKEEKGKNYYRMERSYGSFSRSVTLPTEVDMDKADVQFKKGLLTIVLPKTVKAVTRKS